MRESRTMSTVALLMLAALASSCVHLARVSTTASGGALAGGSFVLDVSADGRYVLVLANAAMDPAIDTNLVADIYRKDTLTGAVELVSIATSGVAGDGSSVVGEMSDDGRWVAFSSRAENLVSGDTNQRADVFLRDIVAGVTTLVSDGSAVASTDPAISANGEVVAFTSSHDFIANGSNVRVWAYTHPSGTIRAVSVDHLGVAQQGFNPSVDGRGAAIAFDSIAKLVPADLDAGQDVYVNVLGTGPVLVSGGSGPGVSSAPSIDAEGDLVAFESTDRLVLPGDTNNNKDIFLVDLAGSVERISVTTAGAEGSLDSVDARISSDGQLVSFVTGSPELTGGVSGVPVAMVRDRATGITWVGSQDTQGNPVEVSAPPWMPAPMTFTGDGHYLAFSTNDSATPDDTGSVADVFFRWWSEPVVTSISPSTISLGATQPVTITGSGFREVDTEVYTNISGADGITFSNVVVVDDTTITATVESVVGIATLGPKMLWVEQQGTGPGPNTGALESCACLAVAL